MGELKKISAKLTEANEEGKCKVEFVEEYKQLNYQHLEIEELCRKKEELQSELENFSSNIKKEIERIDYLISECKKLGLTENGKVEEIKSEK